MLLTIILGKEKLQIKVLPVILNCAMPVLSVNIRAFNLYAEWQKLHFGVHSSRTHSRFILTRAVEPAKN